MGTITVEEFNFKINKLKRIYKRKDFEFCEVHLATPQDFYQAIGEAKEIQSFGAFVAQHSILEYAQMRCLFLTSDNKAGIAVTEDDNIVSIFNCGPHRHLLKTLLPLAIEFGGKKLDNFNSDRLSAMYEVFGFNPVSYTSFDKKFAPEDWNYERDKEPDIFFWIHNGDSVPEILTRFGEYDVDRDCMEYFPSYAEAEDYRDYILRNKFI